MGATVDDRHVGGGRSLVEEIGLGVYVGGKLVKKVSLDVKYVVKVIDGNNLSLRFGPNKPWDQSDKMELEILLHFILEKPNV